MQFSAWPPVLVLLDVLLLLWTGYLVGKARSQYGIKAPATTGNPDFERVFRVQMNTLENSVAFLAALWLGAQYGTAWIVAIAGAVWIVGRVMYALAYVKDARSRSTGFTISGLGLVVLVLNGAIGLGRSLLGF